MLLVLLVMLMLSIPVATHSVRLQLPVGDGPAAVIDPIIHELRLDAAGRTTLDGKALDAASLRAALGRLAGLGERHQLQIIAAANARYEDFDRLTAMISASGVSRLGLVGNERFAQFTKAR